MRRQAILKTERETEYGLPCNIAIFISYILVKFDLDTLKIGGVTAV